jgi:hypothetical protein
MPGHRGDPKFEFGSEGVPYRDARFPQRRQRPCCAAKLHDKEARLQLGEPFAVTDERRKPPGNF